jgi:hypothetical protein
MPFLDQTIAKVGSQESGAAGHQDSFLIMLHDFDLPLKMGQGRFADSAISYRMAILAITFVKFDIILWGHGCRRAVDSKAAIRDECRGETSPSQKVKQVEFHTRGKKPTLSIDMAILILPDFHIEFSFRESFFWGHHEVLLVFSMPAFMVDSQ